MNLHQEELIKAAYEFAKAAHGEQQRKYTGEPYYKHLEDTANFLWEYCSNTILIEEYAAAILHDTVEDTKVTLDEIEFNFGRIVRNLVEELTIDETKKKAEGKRKYLSRKLNDMSEAALSIKLCDRLSNMTDSIDPRVPDSFKTWYATETAIILGNLDRELSEHQKQLVKRIKALVAYIKL